MKQEKLTELLEFLVKSLVDKPDEVTVDQYCTGNTVHLELQVDPEDIGRVIGKHGRVANSLRTLLKVVAARNGMQVAMDVVDVN
ncbi:MAG: KH domain-containing protein [Anaerolineaceae bacterium]